MVSRLRPLGPKFVWYARPRPKLWLCPMKSKQYAAKTEKCECGVNVLQDYLTLPFFRSQQLLCVRSVFNRTENLAPFLCVWADGRRRHRRRKSSNRTNCSFAKSLNRCRSFSFSLFTEKWKKSSIVWLVRVRLYEGWTDRRTAAVLWKYLVWIFNRFVFVLTR